MAVTRGKLSEPCKFLNQPVGFQHAALSWQWVSSKQHTHTRTPGQVDHVARLAGVCMYAEQAAVSRLW